MVSHEKILNKETGRIFRTHLFLREMAHSEAVLLLVAAKSPFLFPFDTTT